MKVYIEDIFPKIQRFSKKLNQLTALTGHHWVSLDDINTAKLVFIFRTNKEVLFSEDGLVEKGYWEYLGYDSILLERQGNKYLFKHAFIDEDVLALKLDGSTGYAVFINETRFGREINSIEDVVSFLQQKYLKNKTPKSDSVVKEAKNEKAETVSEPNILQTPHFNESEPNASYDVFNGKYFIINIRFVDGRHGVIYLGGKSKRYFLQYGFNGIQYFETKQQCIDQLYKQLYHSP